MSQKLSLPQSLKTVQLVLTGNTHDYLGSLSALGNERRVIFYDQLGSGRSDRPSDMKLWTLDRFVEELAQICKSLGLVRFHLFGHSWGTVIVVAYALTQPGGLVSLTLAGPCLSMPKWIEDEIRLLNELPETDRITIENAEHAGSTDSANYQNALQAHNRRNWCRVEISDQLKVRMARAYGAEVGETMWGRNHFFATGNLKECDLTDRLHEIAVPSLFTCGRYDEAVPETTAWYASLVRGSKVVIFEQSAHLPHLEEPELYVSMLREFLQVAENASP